MNSITDSGESALTFDEKKSQRLNFLKKPNFRFSNADRETK